MSHHSFSSRENLKALAQERQYYTQSLRCTWVSILVNLCLSMLQITAGLLAHSQALIADGIHTVSDLFSDALVLFSTRHGHIVADREHPYGHGRIETVCLLALGLILISTGGGLLWLAASWLQHPEQIVPVESLALWFALLTLVVKECLFRYLLGVGKQLRSPLLIANAWHARSDAVSSLVVTAGIAGNLMGFIFADGMAAALVGLMILRIGFKFAWEALSELIDTGLDDEEISEIRNCLITTPGVVGIHELRSRRMARYVLIDVHLLVAPRISVSEGHHIAELARTKVFNECSEVLEVLVHIDPEEDTEDETDLLQLPDRDILIEELQYIFKLPQIVFLLGNSTELVQQIVLHYLDHQVEAEVSLTQTKNTNQLENITREFNELIQQHYSHWRQVSFRLVIPV